MKFYFRTFHDLKESGNAQRLNQKYYKLIGK